MDIQRVELIAAFTFEVFQTNFVYFSLFLEYTQTKMGFQNGTESIGQSMNVDFTQSKIRIDMKTQLKSFHCEVLNPCQDILKFGYDFQRYLVAGSVNKTVDTNFFR